MPEYDLLEQELHFTADDLKQNQKGNISETQRTTLLWRRLRMQRSWFITCIAGAGIGLVGFALWFNNPPLFIGVEIVAVGLLLLALQSYLNMRRAVQADRQAGVARSVTGILRVELMNNHRLLHIQDTYFEVPVKTRQAFEDQKVYTLYYAPQSGVLLSAEQITDDMV